LLFFGYIIRCLLEFRIDERESWLTRAAFVFALDMTSNWGMIGFLPFFLLALIWMKGLSFFNARFLVRMFLWALAGLSLYLLMPLVDSLASISHLPFLLALKSNIGGQRYILFEFFKNARGLIIVLSLTSLIPVILLSIKWSSYFGDNSPMGVALSTFMFHVIHGLFFVACIWIALDPPNSPRNRGLGLPFLTFYYLGALSAGYFAGYFLLVFGTKPIKRDQSRRTPELVRITRSGVYWATWLLLLITPVTLLYRNLHQIRVTNGSMYLQCANLVMQQLPSQGGIVLSDDASRMLLMQAALARSGKAKNYLFLDTHSLPWPDYHRFLKRSHPNWIVDVPKDRQELFPDRGLLWLVSTLGETNTLYYLHPSFGYYFERFYIEPHGLVYKLVVCPTNTLLEPPLSKELIAENEAFWSKADQDVLKPLLAAVTPHKAGREPGFTDSIKERVTLTDEANRDAIVLASYYSRALNYWGVQMQKNGQLEPAGAHFQLAQDLNPNNIVAEKNLTFNQVQREPGRQLPSEDAIRPIREQIGRYRSLAQAMNENGPFDRPNFCFELGLELVQGGNYRQAAQQFGRVMAFKPNDLESRLWLAHMDVLYQLPDDAIKLVGEIRGQSDKFGLSRTNATHLLFVDMSAHLAKDDVKGAESAVNAVLEKYPADENLLGAATQVYVNYRQFTNALVTIGQQLKASPNNPGILVNKGYAHLQLNQFEQGIPPLTQALKVETNATPLRNSALFNRAICYLKSNELDAAKRDYEALQNAFTNVVPFAVDYGLGEIAYLKKDTNAALYHYQRYLTNAPPDSEEAKGVMNRVKELHPASEPKRAAAAPK
jgi:tetratricopeptide (TPR) repeat protein